MNRKTCMILGIFKHFDDIKKPKLNNRGKKLKVLGIKLINTLCLFFSVF